MAAAAAAAAAATAQVAKVMEGLQVGRKEPKGTEKRDALTAVEKKYQKIWQEQGLFNTDPPTTTEVPLHSVRAAELREQQPKWFGTMSYPYMNGILHAGHAFSVSKVEFGAAVARMEGKRALFPMGFHCTGLPIKATADKLVNEIGMFGKDFSGYTEAGALPASATTVAAVDEKVFKEDVTKFSSKKSKAMAKTDTKLYQFQIMRSMGIPNEDIYLFADPQHWLKYFPPIAMKDLTEMGCRIDWRRSFITTDANPYYDAFVRWQMNRLKELGKIFFAKRYSVFSTKDNQPCMDHDRSEGEAVREQVYTAVKLKVLEWAPKAEEILKGKIPAAASVFLVPATLRPETMYGQTCCFVSPTINYGVFKANEKEYYVMTDRAALNMAYQEIFAVEREVHKVADLAGTNMVGTLVHAPLSLHKQGVRVLPMETILPNKGTGVVTSVPSDSPDDYATVMDLAKKADYYGIKKEWAELEIFPIVDTPAYGDLCAPTIVKKMKINSPKDTKQLAEAKNLAYHEGHFNGIMKVGEFSGLKVEAAKPKIQERLISTGDAFVYSEPEKRVVSRSGDECIIAKTDQWYIDYGETKWCKQAVDWVDEEMETYGDETKQMYKNAFEWFKAAPCARIYGLGSKLPWDDTVLVESLGDSTIYMAYYTICHYLHSDLYGQERGIGNIGVEQMVDEVWDYLFCRRELDEAVLAACKIPKDTLESMRREFEYFYPLDLRSTAKDLVPNHLLFFLYIHVAIFPQEYWPRAIRVNGHLLRNGEKMSKSLGNTMSISEMTAKYGADAARIALADAGDGTADGNFDEDTADRSILRLYTLREWCEDTMARTDLREGDGALNTFHDALFDNQMNVCAAEAVRCYVATDYKLALKSGFYDLMIARDEYREGCAAVGITMHRSIVLRYVELQALLMAVVTPHWAEYIWLEVLKKPSSIHLARFPTLSPADAALTAAREYVRNTASNINSAEGQQMKKKAKGKELNFDPKQPKKLTIFTTDKYPAWQDKYVTLLREMWDRESRTVTDEKELGARVGRMGDMKRAMPFVQVLKRRLTSGEDPRTVLDRELGFDEPAMLRGLVKGLRRTMNGLIAVEVLAVDSVREGGEERAAGGGGVKSGRRLLGDGEGVEEEGVEVEIKAAAASIAEGAVPGLPTFFFENV